MANGLAGWSETWKDWKTSDKEVWDRGIDFFNWAKKKKKKKSEDICALGECSPKGEHPNNQVDRLTHFVDTSQPLPRH